MSRFAKIAGNSITWAVAGTVALGLGLTLALTSASPARADQTIDVSYSFPDLLPDVPEEQSGSYLLPQDSRLVSLEWIERTGVFTTAQIGIEVCQQACALSRPGKVFEAGELEIRLRVTLPAEDTAEGAQGSITGRLVFAAEEGELATTGAQLSVALLWTGAALSLSGLLIVAARRRASVKGQGS